MITITPDTRVDMYSNIPISGDHQLFFKNRQEQTAYFNKHRNVTMASCSYINKTGRLRIEFNTARVQQCNYFSFKNESFENVTFYARILDWEYVNNVTTDILYEIDYWQTFMFDVKYHACMIDREHLTQVDYEKAIENPYRRDIPELLTDEGLPVNKELEIHYNIAEFNVEGTEGLRFSLPNYPVGRNDGKYDIIIYLTDCSLGDWDIADRVKFREQFDLVNGSETADITFSSWVNNFLRSYAVLTIHAHDISVESAMTKLQTAISLLTVYGCTSSIIGIYVLPEWMGDGFPDLAGSPDNMTAPFRVKINLDDDPLNGLNIKLKTHPFRYIRIETPKDTKEYNISLFKAAETVNIAVPFLFHITYAGQPSVTLYPVNYRAEYDIASGVQPNYIERIEFSAFPQVGFSSDAYLTYLSETYSSAIKQNTMGGQLNNATGAVGGLASLFTLNILGGASSIGSTSDKIAALYESVDRGEVRVNEVARNLGLDGITRGRGDYATGAKSSYFDSVRKGVVNDNYVAGSAVGVDMYAFNDVAFYFTLVTLEKDIAEKYSDYLNTYGYKSDRIKVPNVCSYITDGTNEPHFETVHGDTLTYVKTQNAHVTGVMQVACSYIENMLNAGVRLIKGE